MLQHVLERCSLATKPIAVALCTDDENLIALANSLGFPALITSPECQSGSERIASITKQLLKLHADPNKTIDAEDLDSELKRYLIINVQGDQPFIDPHIIDTMAKEFSNRNPTPDVLTPVYKLGANKIHNPNIVKTLLANDGHAIYFSRSALPYVRGVAPENWHEHSDFWGHVGIYGYRADILSKWSTLPYSPLEHKEKLEQLRLIEAGIKIGTFKVEGESLSVDTAEQLEQAREIAKQIQS